MEVIIHTSAIYPSRPNYAGGVDLSIVWKNTSSKVVKYGNFEVVPYNAVGDIVSFEITMEASFHGRLTGPVNPGGENLW